MNFLTIFKNEFLNPQIWRKETEKPQNSDYSNLYIYFLVPLHLEKVNKFGKKLLEFLQVSWDIFIIILDCILSTFILIPLRIFLGLICFPFKKGFSILFYADFVHFFLFAISSFFLCKYIEISVIYHGIRGQSQLKLYGLIMLLEVKFY